MSAKRINVSVSDATYDFFERVAKKEGLSQSAFVGRLITGLAEKHGLKNREPIRYRARTARAA